MPELWMPGAEQRPENNGGTMAGGPPRGVWHITWDELGPGGKMPSFDAIMNYLKNVDFCPHLMWDPWSGRIVQFYPANRSARAVRNLSGGVETNRMGKVCLQVEVFFAPGAVVNGKKYITVADTPCKGLGEIVEWMRTWGVPDVWPNGWPKWTGNSRSSSGWAKAGHFGHSQVPENDHSDPGPMPRSMFEEDDMAMSPEEIAKAVLKTDGIVDAPATEVAKGNKFWTPASYLHWGYENTIDTNARVRALETTVAAQATVLAEIKALLQAQAGGTS
jgi:hypothetical protein